MELVKFQNISCNVSDMNLLLQILKYFRYAGPKNLLLQKVYVSLFYIKSIPLYIKTSFSPRPLMRLLNRLLSLNFFDSFWKIVQILITYFHYLGLFYLEQVTRTGRYSIETGAVIIFTGRTRFDQLFRELLKAKKEQTRQPRHRNNP